MPILRSEPRSGNDRVRDQGGFCNIVGGVTSPLLANIFLHHVLDEWFEQDVRPRLQGEAFVIRYEPENFSSFVRLTSVRRTSDISANQGLTSISGGSCTAQRVNYSQALCGRLCDRGSPRRRRPANHGGLTQADEQVRSDGPPGEDAPGAVPTAPSPQLRNRGAGPTRPDDIRLPGIYSLLGTIPTGRMGGQTEDGEEPTQACVSSAIGVVSKKSAPSDQGAAPEAHAKTARPLRVLRDHWQLLQPPGMSGGSAKDLAPQAVSATPRRRSDVGRVPSSGEALQSSSCSSGPRPAERRSEVMR